VATRPPPTAGHGRRADLSLDDQRRFIEDDIHSIERATVVRPKGWSAYWVRNSPHTLDILTSLGFTYYLDEASLDELFILPVKGGDFVTVPYTFHMNDIVAFPSRAGTRPRMSRRSRTSSTSSTKRARRVAG
jgi:hypothetical protein